MLALVNPSRKFLRLPLSFPIYKIELIYLIDNLIIVLIPLIPFARISHPFHRLEISSSFLFFIRPIARPHEATNKGNIRSAISVFPHQTEEDHAYRVWNSQFVKYAGYKNPDGTVTGDPSSIEITEVRNVPRAIDGNSGSLLKADK